MSWKRVLVIGGGITTVPLVLVLSGWAADRVYMRFMFQGDLTDFAPGDAFGELLVFGGIALPFLLVATLFWYKAYKSVR